MQKACAEACEYQLPTKGKVTLIAKPAKGSKLAKWTKDCAPANSSIRCVLPLKHEHDLSTVAVFTR